MKEDELEKRNKGPTLPNKSHVQGKTYIYTVPLLPSFEICSFRKLRFMPLRIKTNVCQETKVYMFPLYDQI